MYWNATQLLIPALMLDMNHGLVFCSAKTFRHQHPTMPIFQNNTGKAMECRYLPGDVCMHGVFVYSHFNSICMFDRSGVLQDNVVMQAVQAAEHHSAERTDRTQREMVWICYA